MPLNATQNMGIAANGPTDKWSDWLLNRRAGGAEDGHRRVLERLAPVRDRVLENARLAETDTLLDVGTGDGLIGLGALDRLGPSGRVIFSDVSESCLRYVAGEVGEHDALRTSFIMASAESLEAIRGESVDVVTTRSVLIYVKEKRAAFEAFFRVLRRNGRISLAEPINRDYVALAHAHPDEYYGYSVPAVADVLKRLRADPPDVSDDPMMDFTHLDLVGFSEAAGFQESHLQLRVDVVPREPRTWDSFVHFAPNPNAKTIGEDLREKLTAADVERIESALRPLVEHGRGVERLTMAYLQAIK